jgi:hypothetical protein
MKLFGDPVSSYAAKRVCELDEEDMMIILKYVNHRDGCHCFVCRQLTELQCFRRNGIRDSLIKAVG